jgi:hypothetical protein
VTISRHQALALACDLVERVERASPVRIAIGPGTTSLALCLKGVLAHRLADMIQGQRAAPPDMMSRLRGHLSSAKGQLVRAARARGPNFQRLSAPGTGRPRVLLVPRSDNHVRDLVPVAEVLAARGAELRWVVFRSDHLRQLPASHAAGIVCDRPSTVWRAPRLLAQLKEAVTALSPDEPLALSPAHISLALDEVGPSLRDLLAAAFSLGAAGEGFRPDLILVGNPMVMEGRLAVALAASLGVPSACIQHGTMAVADPLWQGAGVDLMCVWGSQARDVLERSGWGASRIAITGAPWLDNVVRRGGERRGDTVLVAFSGAGHTVGMREHQENIGFLARAIDKTPSLRWIVRLHPKDDAALYRRAGVTAAITEARTSEPLHLQLATVDVLVTSQSTSAIDAMFAGVPVVTLARAEGEPSPDYVVAGATTHVGRGVPLEDKVREALAGQPASVRTAARACADGFFGQADGRSAERVADRLEGLIRKEVPGVRDRGHLASA